ncbi:hypothetical protein [Mycobacterium kiyosense]|nr:hypothetical protein IWGMT90018_44330 [Mycobacterium kiyosense]
MAAAVFLGVLAVEIAVQMRRIEGRFPALAMIEFGFGMLFVLEFLYLLFFWQTATFRADRDPKLVELLNDMAWDSLRRLDWNGRGPGGGFRCRYPD